MTVEAYAKVNLTLEVCGVRPDGYHELRSVVMPISLSDTLEVEVTDDGTITSDTGYGDDLCVKAASVLRAAVPGLPTTLGAAIRVRKRIPAGGGLGGGSADAAAVLRALNEQWLANVPLERLMEIGARVGSDVPALVAGGTVLMEGRGERVAALDAPTGRLHLVLADPGVHSSTKAVYAACAVRAKGAPSATDAMVAAVEAGDLTRIAAAVSNDLLQPAKALHPEIAEALETLRAAGLQGVSMTGSGSCVFGFAADGTAAARLANALDGKPFRTWHACGRSG